MSWDLVTSDVALHAALPEPSAFALARAVVQEIGAALLGADRRDIAHLLPEWLGEAIDRGTFEGDIDAPALYRRIARRLGVGEARAVELAKLVASAVTHRTEAEAIQLLRSRLAPSIAELFVDRPHDVAAPLPERAGARSVTKLSSARGTRQEQRRETLAAGRPGRKHPVSSSD